MVEREEDKTSQGRSQWLRKQNDDNINDVDKRNVQEYAQMRGQGVQGSCGASSHIPTRLQSGDGTGQAEPWRAVNNAEMGHNKHSGNNVQSHREKAKYGQE